MCLMKIMKVPDNIEEGWTITLIMFVFRNVLKSGVCRPFKNE